MFFFQALNLIIFLTLFSGVSFGAVPHNPQALHGFHVHTFGSPMHPFFLLPGTGQSHIKHLSRLIAEQAQRHGQNFFLQHTPTGDTALHSALAFHRLDLATLIFNLLPTPQRDEIAIEKNFDQNSVLLQTLKLLSWIIEPNRISLYFMIPHLLQFIALITPYSDLDDMSTIDPRFPHSSRIYFTLKLMNNRVLTSNSFFNERIVHLFREHNTESEPSLVKGIEKRLENLTLHKLIQVSDRAHADVLPHDQSPQSTITNKEENPRFKELPATLKKKPAEKPSTPTTVEPLFGQKDFPPLPEPMATNQQPLPIKPQHAAKPSQIKSPQEKQLLALIPTKPSPSSTITIDEQPTVQTILPKLETQAQKRAREKTAREIQAARDLIAHEEAAKILRQEERRKANASKREEQRKRIVTTHTEGEIPAETIHKELPEKPVTDTPLKKRATTVAAEPQKKSPIARLNEAIKEHSIPDFNAVISEHLEIIENHLKSDKNFEKSLNKFLQTILDKFEKKSEDSIAQDSDALPIFYRIFSDWDLNETLVLENKLSKKLVSKMQALQAQSIGSAPQKHPRTRTIAEIKKSKISEPEPESKLESSLQAMYALMLTTDALALQGLQKAMLEDDIEECHTIITSIFNINLNINRDGTEIHLFHYLLRYAANNETTLKVLEFIIQHPSFDANTRDTNNFSILHAIILRVASFQEIHRLIPHLLNHDRIELTLTSGEKKITALQYALMSHSLDILRSMFHHPKMTSEIADIYKSHKHLTTINAPLGQLLSTLLLEAPAPGTKHFIHRCFQDQLLSCLLTLDIPIKVISGMIVQGIIQECDEEATLIIFLLHKKNVHNQEIQRLIRVLKTYLKIRIDFVNIPVIPNENFDDLRHYQSSSSDTSG